MLIVVGWGSASYSAAARQRLAAVVAGFCAEGMATGCLAALPRDDDDRDWLLAFLDSVKRGAAIRTGAIIDGSQIRAGDLTACAAAGLDEAVVVQDGDNGSRAMEMVRTHQESGTGALLGIRVWLAHDAPAGLHRHAAAWRHATGNLLGVELAPFPPGSAEIGGHGAGDSPAPLSCEWLRTTFTLTDEARQVPCPLHRPNNGHADSVREIVIRRQTWMETMGSSPLCRSCDRLVRFTGLTLAPSASPSPMRSYGAQDAGYRDHVGCDLNTLTGADHDDAIRNFLARLETTRVERRP